VRSPTRMQGGAIQVSAGFFSAECADLAFSAIARLMGDHPTRNRPLSTR
jgi:hypothetical protein